MEQEWLAKLKEGDKVVFCTGYFNQHCELLTIAKITKTQIVLSNNQRCTREGLLRGKGRSGSIWKPTKELKEECRKTAEKRQLQQKASSSEV